MRRLDGLFREGMPFELAHRIASAEVLARKRAAKLVGWRWAREAVLVFEDLPGGKVKLSLLGGFRGSRPHDSAPLIVIPLDATSPGDEVVDVSAR